MKIIGQLYEKRFIEYVYPTADKREKNKVATLNRLALFEYAFKVNGI